MSIIQIPPVSKLIYGGSLPCATLSRDPVIADDDDKLELADESADVDTAVTPAKGENQSSIRIRMNNSFKIQWGSKYVLLQYSKSKCIRSITGFRFETAKTP